MHLYRVLLGYISSEVMLQFQVENDNLIVDEADELVEHDDKQDVQGMSPVLFRRFMMSIFVVKLLNSSSK